MPTWNLGPTSTPTRIARPFREPETPEPKITCATSTPFPDAKSRTRTSRSQMRIRQVHLPRTPCDKIYFTDLKTPVPDPLKSAIDDKIGTDQGEPDAPPTPTKPCF